LAALIFPLAVRTSGSLTRTRTSSATTCPCIRTGLCNEFILRFSRRIQRILNFQQETIPSQESLALILGLGIFDKEFDQAPLPLSVHYFGQDCVTNH